MLNMPAADIFRAKNDKLRAAFKRTNSQRFKVEQSDAFYTCVSSCDL